MSDLFSILQKHEKAQETNRPTKGIVQSVDGDRVNVLVRGSSTVLRSVKAIGTATVAGQEAILTWENGTPTAHIVGGATEPSSLVAFSRGPQGPQGLAGPEGPAGAQGPAGADGVDGADGAEFRGDWSSETAYLVGEIVRHIGASWGCVEANTGQEPYHPTGPTPVYWVCLGTVETNYSRAAWIHNLTTWALNDDDELVAVGSTTHGAYTAYQHSNKITFGSLKSALQTFFETLFAPLSHGHSENLLASGLSEWDEQASTPATPAADKHKAYFKADGKFYRLNDAGEEVEVGSGAGGGGGTVGVQLHHDQSGGASDSYGALVGVIDGVNKVFTVSQSQYMTGSLQVFLNGQLLIQGASEAWVELLPGSGTFELNDAPLAGDELSTSYQTIGDVIGTGDRTDQSGGASDTYGALSGAIDGVNTTFTVANEAYVSGTLRVYLNGQLQTQGTGGDWTEAISDVGTFDFATAPLPGDQITVTYKVPGAGSGDADTLNGYHASAFAMAGDVSTLGNITWNAVAAFSNGWVNFGGTEPVVQYGLDGLGRLWLKGTMKDGATGVVAFTLPNGFRPVEKKTMFAVHSGGVTWLDIAADGSVIPWGTTAPGFYVPVGQVTLT